MTTMRRRADMVPVLFKGGPLHRQVHVWAKTDAESTEIVRMYRDDGSGLYTGLVAGAACSTHTKR